MKQTKVIPFIDETYTPMRKILPDHKKALTLGKLVRQARELKKLNKAQVSREIKLSPQLQCNIENDYTISNETLEILASYYKLDKKLLAELNFMNTVAYKQFAAYIKTLE